MLSFSDPQQAEDRLNKAIKLREENGLLVEAAESRNVLGQIYHNRAMDPNCKDETTKAANLRRAEELIDKSVEMRKNLMWSPELAQSKTSLATLYKDIKSPREAATAFKEALELYVVALGPFHSRI